MIIRKGNGDITTLSITNCAHTYEKTVFLEKEKFSNLNHVSVFVDIALQGAKSGRNIMKNVDVCAWGWRVGATPTAT